MPIELPALPFAYDALEPHMSTETLKHHYGHHHKAYVDKLVRLIRNTPYERMTLDEIIAATAGNEQERAIFNNAAQAWNHAFFWRCLRPHGGGSPSGKLASMIHDTFGDLERFGEAFLAASLSRFGSGWCWLVVDKRRLTIMTTPNAECPLGETMRPLLVCDLWEHAYYLDYQHRRQDYVQTFLTRLVDWDFVGANLDAAEKRLAA